MDDPELFKVKKVPEHRAPYVAPRPKSWRPERSYTLPENKRGARKK